MPKKVEGLEQLLVEDLQDLFDAEKQLVKALPKMAKLATDGELESALREHLEITRGQVQRIEQVFESMDMRARSRTCRGMQGIIEEGRGMLEEELEEGILDSAITGAARKVEHYEIVGYESARALAQKLGMREAVDLLQQTLREEIQADRQLAQISKRLLAQSDAARGRRALGASARAVRQARGRMARGRASAAASTSRPKGRGRRAPAGRPARPLTDHEEIRDWAEERGAHPACVRRTGGRGDVGMIRLDFPGYTGEESLQAISWDDWFDKFDRSGLALMVQETTAGGQKSNFNKLVKRSTAQQRPRARAAGMARARAASR